MILQIKTSKNIMKYRQLMNQHKHYQQEKIAHQQKMEVVCIHYLVKL
jgi:hypothetical protein